MSQISSHWSPILALGKSHQRMISLPNERDRVMLVRRFFLWLSNLFILILSQIEGDAYVGSSDELLYNIHGLCIGGDVMFK